MSKSTKVELDRATRRAWRRYRVALADAIVGLEDGSPLVVGTEGGTEEHGTPYVQFLRSDEGDVWAEVSANRFLAPGRRIDRDSKRLLAKLGWQKPDRDGDRPNWWAEGTDFEVDRLVKLAVDALRQVFGVPHPAFLTGGVEFGEDPDLDALDQGSASVVAPDEPLAVRPRDLEHLTELVDEALTPFFGHPPVKDDDGDIPIECGQTVVFVRPHPTTPLVRLFACLAVAVSEPERAAFEVAVLNREHPEVKFALRDDSIHATFVVPAMPFAPDHLRRAAAVMGSVAEDVVPDLLVRVGAEPWLSLDDPDA